MLYDNFYYFKLFMKLKSDTPSIGNSNVSLKVSRIITVAVKKRANMKMIVSKIQQTKIKFYG